MRFKLDKHNFNFLLSTVELAKTSGAESFEIELAADLENLFPLSEIVPYIYPVLDYEIYFPVWLKNFPFCAVSFNAIDHIKKTKEREKRKECRNCSLNDRCPGFPEGYFKKFGEQEICPMPDLPEEVMIEVEPKCNFNCQFCFNQVSFAKNGRDLKSFSTAYVKKIIDNVSDSGIGIIRFTGGEPLLRKDIFTLLKYAKEKGLETRLNTNGSLINNRAAGKLKGIVDNILIPIESWTDAKESKIAGFKNALKKKIKAIELLKEQEIPIVRVGTVATRENILNLDQIAQLVFSLPIDEWELYRPIPINKKKILDSRLVNLLADKLIDLRKNSNRNIYIANAIPFCSIKDLNKLNAVSKGALYDDGHRRIVIDPRGFIKPHYFMDENVGQPTDILSAWQSDFMKKMRKLEFIPKECEACPFVFKCRGGSRQAAKMIFGGYDKLDPLANMKNKIR